MLSLGCSLCHIRKRYNNCELLCGEFMWQITKTNHPDNFLVDFVSSHRKPQPKRALIHEAQALKPEVLLPEKPWTKPAPAPVVAAPSPGRGSYLPHENRGGGGQLCSVTAFHHHQAFHVNSVRNNVLTSLH